MMSSARNKSRQMIQRMIMKRVAGYSTISVLLLAAVLGLVLIGGCARSETATPTQEGQGQIFRNVTPTQAATLIREEDDLVVLDVRTPEEFSQERIENAINVDYYSNTFKDDLNRLDKAATYLLYCRTRNRSSAALSIMKSLEFQEVHHLLGGIDRWKQEGLPTVR